MNAISPLSKIKSSTGRKPRLLVVDDEPDNLDLLYRTFRREYQVLRAESGTKALEILADVGEVAVIISDQRMPEMTGTEFLSRTVPEFPDTVRIILTGFTDVEDLVQAINSGQVYRYITKPWDPDTLKKVVQQAVSTYEVLKKSDQSFYIAEHQVQLMATVVQLASLNISEQDALQRVVEGWGKTLSAQVCAIQAVENELPTTKAVFGQLHHQRLDQTSLVKTAIATHTIQAIPNIETTDADLDRHFYEATGTSAHLVAPIIFQNSLLATVSLQWSDSYHTLDDVAGILKMATPQIAQALMAIRCR